MNMRTDKKDKREHVLFILDESGSMGVIKNVVMNGINEQIQELKKTDQIDTYVSLVKFSSDVEVLYWDKPLSEVELLTPENYQPNGMTAMLDAVGQSVSRLKNDTVVGTDDVSFLVVIVSDGAENASREYTWETTQKIIAECKSEKRWTITYMGANQDLSVIQAGLGIDAGNMMLYKATTVGTQSAFTLGNTSTATYRGLRMSSTANELAVSGVASTFYVSNSNSLTADGYASA